MTDDRAAMAPRRSDDASSAAPITALVVGEDEASVHVLGAAAAPLLAAGTTYMALELGTDQVDAELAWGTRTPLVRPLRAPGTEPVDDRKDGGIGLPMPESGDVADAVLEAVRHVGADLIVAAGDDRGRLARLVSGSATDALVHGSPVPVLVVNGAGSR